MFGYAIGFFYDPGSNQYQYREPLKGDYGNMNSSGYNMYTYGQQGKNMTTSEYSGGKTQPGKFRSNSEKNTSCCRFQMRTGAAALEALTPNKHRIRSSASLIKTCEFFFRLIR